MNELFESFYNEVKEALVHWEECCMKLEEKYSRELIESLFRFAHNIKGTAKMFDFEAFGSFVHRVEDLIVALKEGDILPGPEIIDCLFESCSVMGDWLEKMVESPEVTVDTKHLFTKIDVMLPGKSKTLKSNGERLNSEKLTVDSPLVVNNIPELLKTIQDSTPHTVFIKSKDIDTAGYQLLAALVKDKISIEVESGELLKDIHLIGVKELMSEINIRSR